MDFFRRQEQARRNTRYLVLLFLLATVGIVLAVDAVIAALAAYHEMPATPLAAFNLTWLQEHARLLILTSLATVALIAVASVFKIAMLSGGGGKVARDMGGTLVSPDVSDPLRRRLYNVVEEMAIASGVPVPEVYVLEEEGGLNAFAAGFAPGDAAVAVTRGCLEKLNRDELQGVIAHEFSHILNGDMRLNMRLMGVLFGILAIGMIGRTVLRVASRSRGVRSSRGRGGGGGALVALALGVGLTVIGYVGLFFGRLIKAAVSRQREYLADASAVQFTRQTQGIAGALKKIGGYHKGSRFEAADSEEVAHMLFAAGARAFARLFATHPPLLSRIRALEPRFEPEEFERIASELHEHPPTAPPEAESQVAAAAAAEPAPLPITPQAVTQSVGNPGPDHVARAAELRRAIPSPVYQAAKSIESAPRLMLALLLDADAATRVRQLALLTERYGDEDSQQVADYYGAIRPLGRALRLPLLNIAFPALKQAPHSDLQIYLEAVHHMIHIDGEVDTFEYVLSRLLESHLEDAQGEGPRERRGATLYALRGELQKLFSVVARHGHASQSEARAAYALGMHSLLGAQWPEYVLSADWVAATDQALRRLDALPMLIKESLIQSLVLTASHDGKITVSEAELLRGICGVLHCPLPPFLFHPAAGAAAPAG